MSCEWCRCELRSRRSREGGSAVDGGGWGVVDARAAELAGAWPPSGAHPVVIDDVYERFADAGVGVWSCVSGLQGVWRRGDEVFAEVGVG